MASVENQEQRTAAIAGAGSVLGRDIVHGLAAKGSPTAEKTVAYALLAMTMVTGLVDAVSFLSLGRVFTANMTGNIVLLAFATARVPGLSITRSLAALVFFLSGAMLGGRIMAPASGDSHFRFAARAFLLEVV